MSTPMPNNQPPQSPLYVHTLARLAIISVSFLFMVLWLLLWLGGNQTPNGAIAFMSNRDGDWDIYTLDLRTGVTRLMTIDPPRRQNLQPIDDRYPVWSPDGTRIAYHANPTNGVNGVPNWDIYVMNADGTNITQVTNAPEDDAMPAWSPDGRQLAFHSIRTGNWDIYTVTWDEAAQRWGDERRITNFAGEDTFPVWSPDGTMLAYSSERDGDGEIYLRIGIDGAPPDSDRYNVRKLTDNAYNDFAPAFSPDSQNIVYVSDRANGNQAIYVAATDGSSDTQLTDATIEAWNPSFTRDGASIVFVSRQRRTPFNFDRQQGVGIAAIEDSQIFIMPFTGALVPRAQYQPLVANGPELQREVQNWSPDVAPGPQPQGLAWLAVQNQEPLSPLSFIVPSLGTGTPFALPSLGTGTPFTTLPFAPPLLLGTSTPLPTHTPTP
jgi:dipeptidyl aminopeptidase/acylaminoacyl peptidase